MAGPEQLKQFNWDYPGGSFTARPTVSHWFFQWDFINPYLPTLNPSTMFKFLAIFALLVTVKTTQPEQVTAGIFNNNKRSNHATPLKRGTHHTFNSVGESIKALKHKKAK